MSRLSLAAYLIHPVVMEVMYGGMAHPVRYSVLTSILYVVGMWGVVYICSILLFLLVEKPFMNIEVLVFKRLGLMGGKD